MIKTGEDRIIMKYKKTERIYTPVENMAHFATKIGKFGDKAAYRYFDRQHNLLSITYKNLSAKFLQQAAGLPARGSPSSVRPPWSGSALTWLPSPQAV